ncbi:MAG TPA: polysaccharide biosynthesis/export family protein [Rhizomicrobium sp.]|jgi:polysaccharide export outer membrane protein|nr:polysaccharide biosynthesis/export family protein [Rhizomicrobium sp.]
MIRRKSAVFASFLAFVVMSACTVFSAYGATSSLAPDADSSYRLGTGDKVRVIVFDEEDLGGEFQIDDGGYIRLPLIGQLKASGCSPRELETQIAAALADGYLNAPRVSVEVTDYRPFYIIGQVNKPGQYAYVNDMTALNAVALGGGYTVQASDSSVYIRHEGEKEEQKYATDATTRIQPGDVVRVPRTLFWSAITLGGPISAIVSTRWYLPTPPP